MLAKYQCSICESIIPNRKHCSVGSVGYDPFFDGFASLSKVHYACFDCIHPIFPNAMEKKFFDQQPACRLCNLPKTKYRTRSRLHVPEMLDPLFPESEVYGCYECIGKNLIGVLNDYFENSSSRIRCPDCRRPKGKKSLYLVEITRMGSLAYGDLFFTCRPCFKRQLGWRPN